MPAAAALANLRGSVWHVCNLMRHLTASSASYIRQVGVRRQLELPHSLLHQQQLSAAAILLGQHLKVQTWQHSDRER